MKIRDRWTAGRPRPGLALDRLLLPFAHQDSPPITPERSHPGVLDQCVEAADYFNFPRNPPRQHPVRREAQQLSVHWTTNNHRLKIGWASPSPRPSFRGIWHDPTRSRELCRKHTPPVGDIKAVWKGGSTQSGSSGRDFAKAVSKYG